MVTVISFSSRENGNCSKILDFLRNNMEDVAAFSFADFFIHPCGKCDYQCFTDRFTCPYICDMEFKLLETVSQSEKAYFIVPNYCDHPNANYFIFNERSNCFFQGQEALLEQYLKVPKKFIVVSNVENDHFREAFIQQTNEEPELLIIGAKEFGKQSIDGNILPSEAAENKIKAFL